MGEKKTAFFEGAASDAVDAGVQEERQVLRGETEDEEDEKGEKKKAKTSDAR